MSASDTCLASSNANIIVSKYCVANATEAVEEPCA